MEKRTCVSWDATRRVEAKEDREEELDCRNAEDEEGYRREIGRWSIDREGKQRM